MICNNRLIEYEILIVTEAMKRGDRVECIHPNKHLFKEFKSFVTINKVSSWGGHVSYSFHEIPNKWFESAHFIQYTPKSEIFQGLYNKLL